MFDRLKKKLLDKIGKDSGGLRVNEKPNGGKEYSVSVESEAKEVKSYG